MSTCAVLFDFDGTLGDTETPAMEVAFWEVAPFIPALPIGEPSLAPPCDAWRVMGLTHSCGRLLLQRMMRPCSASRRLSSRTMPGVHSSSWSMT